MFGTIVQIAAGLYYTISGIYILEKLDGNADLVTPTSNGRPVNRGQGTFGFLGFQAGLHEPQLIPDSGLFKHNQGAWTVKIPWEIHLKRNVPPEELYDPENPYWREVAELHALREFFKAPAEMQTDYNRKMLIQKYRDLYAQPLPQEVTFNVTGNWKDAGTPVIAMSISIVGRKDFVESSMDQMRSINKGEQQNVGIEVDGKASSLALGPDKKATYPFYFDRVYNAYFSILRDWSLSFDDLLLLTPNAISEMQLRRWFNYEDPIGVALHILQSPNPSIQTLDLTW
jgi:hypothetical protein